MLDVRQRIDLAFTWLYEEYCLLQGFTRHSYVKSENRPDHAYNELLSQLIKGVRETCDLKDKIHLMRRILLEAPLLPDEALNQLVEMCFSEEFVNPGYYRIGLKFALEWATHLEKEVPPPSIFAEEFGRPEAEVQWKEETAKTCLTLLLTLLPYKPKGMG
ncbi:unnamed protein product [Ceratitis capitata]|uniref:(Mediterranean fruit fly) hypothetical protein n=1 Tax=Ceratitis capitata TaxID=7213 RepID=A0A811TZH0_CERCA|nr:unnamed protein product [Ceratitis capitata]